MCVVSMVMDHYRPQFDRWLLPAAPTIHPWAPGPNVYDPEQLKKIIEQFKRATEAAETVDKLTAQPDCEDPEKAKLREQVARLEKIVDQLLEQLAAKGATP